MQTFVTKSYATSKVKIFWFNNKDYQVIFKDLTEILVTRDKFAVFVNKMGERREFVVSEFLKQTEDISKRMKYVLDLILNIKESNTQKVSESEANK